MATNAKNSQVAAAVVPPMAVNMVYIEVLLKPRVCRPVLAQQNAEVRERLTAEDPIGAGDPGERAAASLRQKGVQASTRCAAHVARPEAG
jgi:hypothetical protein